MSACKSHRAQLALALLATLTICEPALAYVGPGAGLTMLGSLLGVLGAIVLAIGGLLFWPIRAMLARRRAKQRQATDHPVVGDEGTHASH
jgi:protein-S-isoprenylcysteine O-methyltransferase Ste14